MTREVPEEIEFECPDCDDYTIHEVLKGKMGKTSLEATLRCESCGRTFSTTIRLPKMVSLKVVISDGPVSETITTEVEEDERIAVDDEFFIEDGRRLRVCSIELDQGKRVKRSRSQYIRTVWAQQFDVLTIKVTVNNDRVSYPKRMEALPDDEFTIGQVLSFDDMDCVINNIKTRERLVSNGSAEAREVVRIYGGMRPKSYPVLDLEEDDV